MAALSALTLAALSCSSSGDDDAGSGGSGAASGSGRSGSTSGGNGAGGSQSGGGAGASGKGTGGSTAGRGGSATGSGGSSSGSSGKGGSPTSSGGDDNGGMGETAGGSDQPVAIPDGLLNPDYTTTWNPGILKDTQLNLPLGDDGLPVRSKVCASPKPGDDLNAALDGCTEGQVVELAAGKYTVSTTITLKKGVVLRGAGSGDGGTVIVKTGGGSVIQIGDAQDQACYQSNFAEAQSLSADALKETTTVTLGSGAAKFAPGDFAQLDEVDDDSVQEGDCSFFKRVDKRSTTERVEIAAVDASAGTVSLSTPLHWTFRTQQAAQISKVSQDVVRYAGIEHLALQGGDNPNYDGQAAGGIEISNAAYSWVKDVQTDDTIGGMHVDLTGTYRVVVRDGYFHNSADYGFAHDCYGIVLRCGTADSLVENNVVRYMNKPILFNVSGGGNVVGYNYADNSWADPPGYQEKNIDCHCSFPHMELMEGNYAPHMGATTTHGNAGYLTFFRNYSSSQFAAPPVAGSDAPQTAGVAALTFDDGDLDMTVIGNVLGSSAATDLGTAAVSNVFQCFNSDGSCIYELGSKSDIAVTSMWAHGNYDTVNAKVLWAADIAVRELPASLYLSHEPAWWPADVAWPWAGADLDPMVGTLPAKARSDAL